MCFRCAKYSFNYFKVYSVSYTSCWLNIYTWDWNETCPHYQILADILVSFSSEKTILQLRGISNSSLSEILCLSLNNHFYEKTKQTGKDGIEFFPPFLFHPFPQQPNKSNVFHKENRKKHGNNEKKKTLTIGNKIQRRKRRRTYPS